MAHETSAPPFFLLITAAAALLLSLVIWPIASELFLAAVLATVLWPLQEWLGRRFRSKGRSIAAGMITVAVVVAALGPISALVAVVIRDGSAGIDFVSETLRGQRVTSFVDQLPETARDVIHDGIAQLPRNMDEVVGQVGGTEVQTVAAVGAAKAAGSLLFHATIMVIALFFFLVRGDELVRWLDGISPLREGQTQELLASFKKVSYSVIVSTLLTAGVQTAAALAGYYVARVPSPIFFGALTFFAAFIPAVGAGGVGLAAALLLFVTGHVYAAAFLAIWSLVVVGLVDNLLKPLLIKRGMEIHGAVVFFSLVGGLATFGAIGLLLGPLAVAMFLALVRMYHRDYSSKDSRLPELSGELINPDG